MCLADVANSEAVDDTIESGVARALDGGKDVAGALVGHAVEAGELFVGETKEIVEFLDQTCLDKLGDQLVAEAVDIESCLGGKMANRLAHPGRTVEVDAEVGNLPFFVDNRAATYGAMRRHLEFGRAGVTGLGNADDVGDDVAGALDENRIILADVLAANLVEIVQGGVGDRHARRA